MLLEIERTNVSTTPDKSSTRYEQNPTRENQLRIKTPQAWTCCQQHVSKPPCTSSPTHTARRYRPGELAQQHQFHRTPSPPQNGPRHALAAAVALDCEMGTSKTDEPELIRVTLVDYFSGASSSSTASRPYLCV